MRFEPLKGALCAVVVRSPHAHAPFRIADIAVARGGLPGVRLVLTAPGIAELGGLPRVAIPEGVKVDAPPYPVLARDVGPPRRRCRRLRDRRGHLSDMLHSGLDRLGSIRFAAVGHVRFLARIPTSGSACHDPRKYRGP